MHFSPDNHQDVRERNPRGDSPLETLQRRFQDSHHQQLRQVLCHFHEGVMTLRGTVTSFYVKQLAQGLIAGVPGIAECDNRIEVRVAPGSGR